MISVLSLIAGYINYAYVEPSILDFLHSLLLFTSCQVELVPTGVFALKQKAFRYSLWDHLLAGLWRTGRVVMLCCLMLPALTVES